MNNTRKLLPALAALGALPMLYGASRNQGFKLPDIPDAGRIRVYTPKVRKHQTKRRMNKLHERRKK